MTPRARTLARAATALAAAAIAACLVVLAIDDAAARRRAPRDDRLILELQDQARTDAAAALRLEAEHKRITQTRLARKARIDRLAVVLMLAGALFLIGAKRLLPVGPKLPALPRPPAPRAATPPVPAARSAPAPPPNAALDLAVVDRIVAREGRSAEAAIAILQAIQDHFRYLPDEAMRRVCELTEVTPAQIAGTSSFYTRFRRSPVGRHMVRVCHGTACHVAGAREITAELRRALNIPDGGDTDRDRLFTVEEVACLGCCSLAPVLMVDDQTAGRLTPSSACEAVERVQPREPV